MFALFNPPRNRKTGKLCRKKTGRFTKCRKPGRKPKAARGRKAGVGSWRSFLSRFAKSHKGQYKGGALAKEAGAQYRDLSCTRWHNFMAGAGRKPRGKMSEECARSYTAAKQSRDTIASTLAERQRQEREGREAAARSKLEGYEDLMSLAANPRKRSSHMRGRKRRGGGFGSFVRAFNPGGLISLAPPSGAGSITAGIKPANITGVLPIVGGVIANAMVKGMVSKFIPKTTTGLGSHLLGLATAGVVGALGNLLGKQVGSSMLTGALVQVGSGVFGDIQAKGIGGAFALGDDFGEGLAAWDFARPDLQQGFSMSGMGDFVTPQAIQAAFPASPTQYQYALPAPDAQATQAATVSNAGGRRAVRSQDAVLAEIIDADMGGGF